MRLFAWLCASIMGLIPTSSIFLPFYWERNRKIDLNPNSIELLVKKLIDEGLIPLKQAHAIFVKYNPKVTYNNIYNWQRNGTGGAKLESIKIGGEVYTSEPAIIRFIAHCTTLYFNTLPPNAKRFNAHNATTIKDIAESQLED